MDEDRKLYPHPTSNVGLYAETGASDPRRLCAVALATRIKTKNKALHALLCLSLQLTDSTKASQSDIAMAPLPQISTLDKFQTMGFRILMGCEVSKRTYSFNTFVTWGNYTEQGPNEAAPADEG